MLLSMQRKTTLAIIAIMAVVSTFAVSSGKLFSPAYACETNANGCIENGGPGSSIAAPPEVSGCHVFPPVPECAQSSTPPGMGQGPK